METPGMTPGTEAPDEMPPGAGSARLSGAAVLAVLLAVASLLGCAVTLPLSLMVNPSVAVGIFVTFACGLIAAVLGFVSLRRIGRSGGALGGRPVAVLGLFVGLLSAVTQGSIILGAAGLYYSSRNALAPAASRLARALGEDDAPMARLQLEESTARAIDDDRISWVGDALTTELGAFQRASFDLDIFTEMLTVMSTAPDGTSLRKLAPRVIRLEYDAGPIMTLTFLDEKQLKQNRVRFTDVLFILPDDRAATLMPDGIARQAARLLGRTVVEPAGAGGEGGAGGGGGGGATTDGPADAPG